MTLTLKLKKILRENQLGLKKSLSQNIMVSESILTKIASLVAHHRPVIEIGAGLGFLTKVLLEKGLRVTAIERDARCCEFLKQEYKAFQNLVVKEVDVLLFNFKNLSEKVTVVGNIPYRITTPILLHLLSAKNNISEIMLVIQKEVAERLCAAPGSKKFGRISCLVQWHCDIRWIAGIPSHAFYPIPRVDSALVHLSVLQKSRIKAVNETLMFDLIKTGFGKRRKTLVNALEFHDRLRSKTPQLKGMIERLELPVTVRAESLSLEQWARLTQDIEPLLC